jgi:hypothetical protein
MNESVSRDELSAALEEIASWLLAAYGARLEGLSLALEVYYGPVTECFGIVPITLNRGVRPDGTSESQETLPSRQIRDHAEALLGLLVPSIRCIRDPVRDVHEVASSSFVRARDVSGHRRIELLRKYGGLPTVVADRCRP